MTSSSGRSTTPARRSASRASSTYDAFIQISSNPLLSRNVYGPATFTRDGLDVIEATPSIQARGDRNVDGTARASLAA